MLFCDNHMPSLNISTQYMQMYKNCLDKTYDDDIITVYVNKIRNELKIYGILK